MSDSLRSPSAEALTLLDSNDVGVSDDVLDHLYCPAERVVANWHNGVHKGAFKTCQEQPCRGVQMVCD